MPTKINLSAYLGKIGESEDFYLQLKSELEKEIANLQMEMGNESEKIFNLDFFIEIGSDFQKK